ncbi:GNAT family N-acetyltransferase [Dactylosporangium vinaceum]|uniref:Enhanced intracellular survival protein Eis n=1 Tax=Dactylosporangium vinaceum TaxID=53362 RepID=A0ABV5MDN0_9ACTN|nr:GNAT family N-acetyltransferase [Dactylosporangium vinaceum]UAC01113.1 GNAT family N-acetyltransferase [Dactylosporangium vinaceum]
MSTIRRVHGDERLGTAFTLYPYAFDATPSPGTEDELRALLPYHRDNTTLVAEEDGRTVATASAFPAQQNLRGNVLPMAGIGWVATQPDARRQGHGSRLMHRLHAELLDSGHLLATLYPFHPAFYERFGYVGLPLNRTATFPPAALAPLLGVELPGQVTQRSIRDGFEDYRAFQRQLMAHRHGYTYTADYRAARALDPANRWLATAVVDGAVVGVLTYHIDGYGGTLRADELLYSTFLGRALLLRFIATHIHQVSSVVVTVAPDEYPESWVTGLTVRTEAEAAFPTSPPLMARLLSVEALRGARCGPGRVEIEVVDDRLLAGRYRLDGTGGAIDIGPGSGTAKTATLTAAGLAGLAYGVLDPAEVVTRGLGEVPDDAVEELRSLLYRLTPHVFGKG